MSFEQVASGVFTIGVTGPNHCGPNHDSPKQFGFRVRIEWPSDSLDEHGFLLDNLTFQTYFDSLQSTSLSCEKLAMKTASDLWAMCTSRAHNCKVTLTPFQGVDITYQIKSASCDISERV